ncbi:MAG: S-methyl-5'-thioadenosine phosphorylase [Nitrospira sp.]|nr:S-methyl-5'-thioadenosine phosphorylase [Nitrospira sp.]
MLKIGIIGGSGLYNIPGLTIREYKKITTPFGKAVEKYIIGELSGREIVFLPRHGLQHRIPPHKINYRANIWGFRELGVKMILSINAVGGISHAMKPGTIVVPDQIIDMTKGRDSTYYDGDEVVHIDFTEPFCHELMALILKAGKKSGITVKKSGTYICVNGPRLETRAEIKFFSTIGADIVGMTLMPEATLAREAEICFASIAVITNYAAGIAEKKLTVTEVKEVMGKSIEKVKILLQEVFYLTPHERKCACKEACKEARM